MGCSEWVGGAELVGIEAPSYRGFRYPAEIISHCVWLYHRFPLNSTPWFGCAVPPTRYARREPCLTAISA